MKPHVSGITLGAKDMARARQFYDQGLGWPRSGATDVDEQEIAEDEVPIEVVEATIELAVRELASPGSTTPDLERGGSVLRVKAGSVEVQYGAQAIPTTTFTLVDGILAPLIGPTTHGGLTTSIATRG